MSCKTSPVFFIFFIRVNILFSKILSWQRENFWKWHVDSEFPPSSKCVRCVKIKSLWGICALPNFFWANLDRNWLTGKEEAAGTFHIFPTQGYASNSSPFDTWKLILLYFGAMANIKKYHALQLHSFLVLDLKWMRSRKTNASSGSCQLALLVSEFLWK